MNPYLNFNGNTEEAFNFYKSVFGGEFVSLVRFRDTGEAGKLSGADLDKIMHALVKEKPGRTPLSAVKLLKADPVAVLAQTEEIKARYARIFGV